MNFYDMMKEKQQKNFNETVHWFNLFNVLQSMFEYEGLPDTIRQEQLEGILISTGLVGIGEIDGRLWCGAGSYCGNVEGFLPNEYQFAVTGIGTKRGRHDTDISVGWNNATFTPDWILMQYASILSEIDVSEKVNLLFTRFLRIPKVKDQKEKIAIENSIKNIQNGKIEAVVSDNIHDIRELVSSGYNKEDNFLDLVDIKDIDKLQYLNQYRDNIIKRFFQIYGIASQVTNKLAQQNNAEIHANDDVVMTLFLQRYKYRKMLVEDMNQKFGLDVSVKLSDSWMDSYNEIINNSEEQEETEEQEGDEPDENMELSESSG